MALYPVVEAEFDPAANILNTIIAPAAVPERVAERCGEMAAQAVTALEGVGIFGIEFFLTRSGEVILNEISPRPHNSGHYTIEACVTSQFEQHLRAVSGLPLGSPALRHAAASFNLLGEPTAQGLPVYHGLDAIAAMPGAAAHLYGKHSVKPWRKMGHVTVTGSTREEATERAHQLQQVVRVGGSES
jgi:5-(carboxyamino)imidazole ribonucleotide synthase